MPIEASTGSFGGFLETFGLPIFDKVMVNQTIELVDLCFNTSDNVD